jgi:hypothetical protein
MINLIKKNDKYSLMIDDEIIKKVIYISKR